MELFAFLVTLDDEKDVFRQMVLNGSENLEALHAKIVEAFDLNPGEMASFYETDADWNAGGEIPLMKLGDTAGNILGEMQDIQIKDWFLNHEKLLYIYDFFSMWTFYVEKVKLPDDVKAPGIYLSYGERPAEPPEKSFDTEDFSEPDIDESFEDEEDDPYFN